MGDADGEGVIPALENEDWMVDAFGYVDEGLENLLQLVTNLNERNNNISLELKTLRSFQKIFVALNFFIVPVALAIMLCYGTKASFNINGHGIEAVIQRLVMFLMFMSPVGLSFYILSIWKSCCTLLNINEDSNDQSLDDLLIELTRNLSEEFTRFLRNPLRMPSKYRRDLMTVRENLQRGEIKTEKDSFEQKQLQGVEDITEPALHLADIGNSMETSGNKQDEHTSGPAGTSKDMVFPIRYRFKLFMNERSPDMSVRFKPAHIEDIKEMSEDGKLMEHSPDREFDIPHEESPSIVENNEGRNADNDDASS